MAEEIVRVLRVVEYVGPRKWVEETVARALHGTRSFEFRGGTSSRKEIRAATLGTYPEVLEAAGEEDSDG